MRVPGLLLLVSLVGVIAGLARPGWSDILLVAVPAAVASLILLLRAVRRQGWRQAHVILDGSNVMYWRDGTPDIACVQDILALAADLGLTPGVVFDANAGHLLFGKYTDDKRFADRLGLDADRVLVVPKGSPADPTILAAARTLDARIITNDRYRDWVEAFPELETPGRLIRGGYRRGRPWIALARGNDPNGKRRPEGRRSPKPKA